MDTWSPRGRGRGHCYYGVTTLGPITGHGNTRPGSVNMHSGEENCYILLRNVNVHLVICS